MLTALQNVQRKLGPQAVVLSMREIPSGPAWQVWRRAGCEVIAALPVAELPNPVGEIESEPQEAADPPAVNSPRLKAPAAHAFAPLALAASHPAGEPAENHGEPEQKPPTAAKISPSAPETKAILPVPVINARRRLVSQGVDESLVGRMIGSSLQVLTPAMLEDEKRLHHYLRMQLEAGLTAHPRTMALAPNRVICLVGPSGSGKTSACAKLASFYSLNLEKKVAWVGADTVRTGAIAEAGKYTDTLGIPLRLAYTPEDLSAAIADQKDADVILVDTPGCNPRQESQMVELGAFLTGVAQRATYLVLPATMKEADLMQALGAFGLFSLKGIIVTRTDETATLGNIYNLAARSRVPLAYFTTGSRVVGNLHAGDPGVLAEAILNGRMAL